MFEVLFGFFGVCFFFGLMTLFKSVYLVKQAEVVIIERFGKYHCMLSPGLHFIVPFVDTPHVSRWTYVQQGENGRYYRYVQSFARIDLRESVYDFPKQNVITKDNVNIEINALLYYQIMDPKAAVYEVINLPEAIEKLTQTTLRNVIGSLDLDETLISRDQINDKLRIILDEATDKWGVKVNRVELQEVNPPRDIQLAMEKQMRAERDRRAIILEFEGKKGAAILQAEGERESRVLKAKGIAESRILEAEGQAQARLNVTKAEAESILMIQKAVPNGDPLPYMVAQEYIKALPKMMEDKEGKMIVVPYEASSMVGSLSMMKKVFENTK
ncbi:MAG: regulator of protease activity HflC (stomatin/prohibitin superfamily) [Alteromonas naphthalenivorans]|jgi:regulator of protease activity HflC (stomatin/prohibitin superfamily)